MKVLLQRTAGPYIGSQADKAACPAIDLEKNWRKKEKQLAYSLQAIDLIGAP